MRLSRVILLAALLPLALILLSCATPGNGENGSGEPASWIPGEYELTGGVLYRMDTPEARGRRRKGVTGTLYVGPDRSLTLRSSSGICRDRTPNEIQTDVARGQQTFHCVDATFTLKPRGEMVRGTVEIPVWERVQSVRACADHDDTRRCVRWTYSIEHRRVVKRGGIRAIRM